MLLADANCVVSNKKLNGVSFVFTAFLFSYAAYVKANNQIFWLAV